MSQNRKGTGTKPAPTTINDHIILDRLSLLFFLVFFTVIIIEQFYPNDRLIGFAFGVGMASLFTHCVSMKLDSEIQEFDKGE